MNHRVGRRGGLPPPLDLPGSLLLVYARDTCTPKTARLGHHLVGLMSNTNPTQLPWTHLGGVEPPVRVPVRYVDFYATLPFAVPTSRRSTKLVIIFPLVKVIYSFRFYPVVLLRFTHIWNRAPEKPVFLPQRSTQRRPRRPLRASALEPPWRLWSVCKRTPPLDACAASAASLLNRSAAPRLLL